MNAFTADNLGQRPPEAGGQPSDALPVDRLYTSTDIAAMQNEQLAQIVGVTPEGNNLDRSELERNAYAEQLRKLGRIICSFSNSSASEQVSEAQVEAVTQEDDDENKSRLTYYDASPDDNEDSKEHDSYLGVLLEIELSPVDDSGDVAFIPDPLETEVVEPQRPKQIDPLLLMPVRVPNQTDMLGHDPDTHTDDFNEAKSDSLSVNMGWNVHSNEARSKAERNHRRFFNRAIFSRLSKLVLTGASTGALFGLALESIPIQSEPRSNTLSSPIIVETDGAIALSELPESAQVEATIPTPIEGETVSLAGEVVLVPEVIQTPKSVSEKLYSGEMLMAQASGVKFAEVDIPSLCLYGADVYGSNRRDPDNAEALNYFVEKGLLSASEAEILLKGQASTALETKFHKLFDPIYKVEEVQSQQQECAEIPTMEIGQHAPRWEKSLKDLSTPGNEQTPLREIEPVVDIDITGALPGQKGNVIIAGHNTTDSAPFMNLERLRVGDTAVIKTDDGNSYTYRVESIDKVDVELLEKDYYGFINSYTSPTGSEYIATILTCDGEDERVITRLVSEDKA